MATTYDKASLVMIPSGYKDDKLYSVKPTDGSGDFTFSRDGAGASPATRVNASGLIEKGRTNELLQSNFSASWTANSATMTGGQSGYDGSNDAWLFASTGNFARIQQTTTASGILTMSVYAKAGTTDWVMLRLAGSGYNITQYYDLTNGVIGALNSVSASIEAVGGGWYRCEMAVNALAAADAYVYSALGDANLSVTNETLFIQDAQLEQGLVATDYIETTTAPVSAGLLGDMPRLDYSGGATCPNLLLEPSRVNSFIHSEYFSAWSKVLGITTEENSIISPEGVLNATKMIRPNSTSGAWMLLGGTSVTIGQNQVASCFVKEGDIADFNITYYDVTDGDRFFNFDISTQTISGNGLAHATYVNSDIEDYGNGWYRCYVVVEAGNATPQIQFAIGNNRAAQANKYLYIYGAQHEQNASYPTSYIPTYGSASTRALDAPSISSGSSIFNDNEGTFFLEIEGLSDSSSTKVVTIGDGTSNNRLQIFYQAGTNITTNLISGGSSQVTGFTTTTDQEQNHKVLIKYASNNAKMYLDGTEIASDVSVTPPSGLNVLRFNNGTGAAAFEGEVKQLLYFDTALTDAECIALTTI